MSISPPRAAAAFAVGVLVLAVGAGPALAHGSHDQGDLEFVVGFSNEPAYTGSPNAVSVAITHGGQPATQAVDLQVTVSFGDASTDLALEPAFGVPGEYVADLVPSEPGAYTFHITGTVEGEEVDFEMTAGPATFSEVTSLTDAAFPPIQAPDNEELAQRLEQESGRIEAAQVDARAAIDAATSAADDASSARTLAIVAVALGAVGLVLGIASVRRRTTA